MAGAASPSRVLLTEDVNTIRATNNAIFDDIFWVHLAYLAADGGIGHYATFCGRIPIMRRSSPDSRRSTGDVAFSMTRRRPRITASAVPCFQKFDSDAGLVDATLRRILDEAQDYASMPCPLPHSVPEESPPDAR